MTTLATLTKDGALVVGTITRAEYDRERAKADEVHVVLHQPRGGAADD